MRSISLISDSHKDMEGVTGCFHKAGMQALAAFNKCTISEDSYSENGTLLR